LLRLEASAVYGCDWDESILVIQKWAAAGLEHEIMIEGATEVVSHAILSLTGMVEAGVEEAGDKFLRMSH